MDLNRLKSNSGAEVSPLAPGGTFTGAVSTTRSIFDPTEAVTKAFLDGLTPPSSDSTSVDLSLYLDKAGTHHMAGKITVPGDPTAAGQMVNKHYAVTQINASADIAVQASAAAAVSSAVSYIESQLQSSLLPGTIVEWHSDTAPAGFLRTNGAVLTQAGYPDLYAEIGHNFDASGASGIQFNLSKSLYSPTLVSSGYYGISVAFNGTGTVMAAGWAGTDSNKGEVVIYDWSGTDWVKRAASVTAADGVTGDYFGYSIALNYDGTVMAVGARGRGAITGQGGVYIYDWTGSAWVQRGGVLEASDATTLASFGCNVSLDSTGTILVVAAVQWDGTFADQGGVYTFHWVTGAWVQQGAVLQEPTPSASGWYASSVAISSDGQVLAVGNMSASPSLSYQGGVYVYDWVAGNWSLRGSLVTAPDAAANDYFGSSLALNGTGEVMVVGASLWEGAVTNQGGVYILDWNGMSWSQRGGVVSAPSAQVSGNFGVSVAITSSGNMLAIGESTRNVGAVSGAGEVRTYNTPTTPIPTVPVGSFSLPNTVPEETILNNGVFNIIKT